jgi:predicted dehydrogenase
VIQYTAGRQESGLVLESVAPRWRAASRRTYQFSPTPSPGYGGLAGLDFFRQFLTATSGDPTPADAVDALRVLETLDAIYAAAGAGHAVDVEHRPTHR